MNIDKVEFCWHDGTLVEAGNACPLCDSWNALKSLKYHLRGSAYPIPERLLNMPSDNNITVKNANFCFDCGDIVLNKGKICGHCGSEKLIPLRDYLATY